MFRVKLGKAIGPMVEILVTNRMTVISAQTGLFFQIIRFLRNHINTKKIYQPVDFSLKEDNRTFVLKNKLAFSSIDYLNIAYSVLEDGKVIKTGTIGDMAIPAGGTMEVVIDALPVDIREDADYFIRFSATQKSATWWAEAGYEVASEQIQLRNARKSPYRVQRKEI